MEALQKEIFILNCMEIFVYNKIPIQIIEHIAHNYNSKVSNSLYYKDVHQEM